MRKKNSNGKIQRPKDFNQRAKKIVDITIGEITEPELGKNPAVLSLS